jgi:hypothetical protein
VTNHNKAQVTVLIGFVLLGASLTLILLGTIEFTRVVGWPVVLGATLNGLIMGYLGFTKRWLAYIAGLAVAGWLIKLSWPGTVATWEWWSSSTVVSLLTLGCFGLTAWFENQAISDSNLRTAQTI